MKKNLLFIYSLLIYNTVSSQVGEWKWIHGDSASHPYSNTGNFGTQGVPSASNEPPAFYEACEWKDLNGNLWLFGGNSTNSQWYGDLWKYDPIANEWTWMKGPGIAGHTGSFGTQGVPSPTNYPPARGHAVASWTDNNGNFWMMGGMSFTASTSENVLWKYDVSTNEWTWIKGAISGSTAVYGIRGVPDPANIPEFSAENPAAWTDNAGDLWLYSSYHLSVIWRYNISSNSWTWMKGDTAHVNHLPILGTMGTEDSTNTPGDRSAYSHWIDFNGNLWMFGGATRCGSGVSGYCPPTNDLWRYNISTNNWTWMNGDTTHNMGSYGTKCVTTASNLPASRLENRAVWTDQNGNFWMFGGGYEYISSGGSTLNDLWKYCPAINQWTWISGDSTIDAAGNWGTLGVSVPSNKPKARMGAIGWYRPDSSGAGGHLYLFGGWFGNTVPFIYNDLWEFIIDTTCGFCSTGGPHASFQSSDTSFCDEGGKCIDFFDHSAGSPTSWKWLFPGANPDSSTQQNPTNICFTQPGTYAVTLIVTNSTGTDTLAVSPMITLGNAPAPPTINVIGGDTLISSHASSYQWYFNGSPIGGAIDSFYVATTSGTYSVYITDSLGCSVISSGLAVGIEELISNGDLSIYPNPTSQSAVISWQSEVRGSIEIIVLNVLGEKVYGEQHQTLNSKLQTNINVSSLTNGIYFLKIESGDRIIIKKFVVMHK